jgi:hypothetical protein
VVVGDLGLVLEQGRLHLLAVEGVRKRLAHQRCELAGVAAHPDLPVVAASISSTLSCCR